MNKHRESNEKARQNYPIQRQQQNTQKLFRYFFRNNQHLPNQRAPNTYVSLIDLINKMIIEESQKALNQTDTQIFHTEEIVSNHFSP